MTLDDIEALAGRELVAGREWERQKQTRIVANSLTADAALSERDEVIRELNQMLKLAYDDVSLFPFIEDEPYEVGLNKYLADLRARSQEADHETR
jgi:hypothetical protein